MKLIHYHLSLNIEKATQFQVARSVNLTQIFSLKNLTFCKECMSSLRFFCQPEIWQFLIAVIFFVIDCKELKLAQTAQIDQLFQLLTLICIRPDFP